MWNKLVENLRRRGAAFSGLLLWLLAGGAHYFTGQPYVRQTAVVYRRRFPQNAHAAGGAERKLTGQAGQWQLWRG